MKKIPLLLILLSAAAGLAAPESYEIRNETFDFGADGVPIEWKPYPPATGDMARLAAAENGGLLLVNGGEAKSVGVGQWIRVEGGHGYRASLTLEGEGGVFLEMNFTSRIPPKLGQMNRIKIHALKVLAEPGQTTVLEGVAPVEATHAWVWVYSPAKALPGLQMVVKSLKVEDLGAAPPENVPAAATPTPKP
jgi:hypothetical protein